MPIWLALYTSCRSRWSCTTRDSPGWLDDLTAKTPTTSLPVAMGITMVLTQVLTPTPMSQPAQK